MVLWACMSDQSWQRLAKNRRAAVYRAIGRAARLAREDRAVTLVADLRIAIAVLRSHARPKRPRSK